MAAHRALHTNETLAEYEECLARSGASMAAHRALNTNETLAGRALSEVDSEITAPLSMESLVQPSTLLTWVRDYEQNDQEGPERRTAETPAARPV